MEVELFDTGVLKKEETTNEPAFSTFVPPNLATRLGAVPAVTYWPQSSSEPGQRKDVQDRLGKAPSETRSETRSETTSTSREERRPDISSLMWSRPIPSP